MSDYKRNGPAGTRMRLLRNVQRTVHIFVEVCMAQRRTVHAEADLIVAQLRPFREVLQANVLSSVINESSQCCLPSQRNLTTIICAQLPSEFVPGTWRQDAESHWDRKCLCRDQSLAKLPFPSQSSQSATWPKRAAHLDNAQAGLHPSRPLQNLV